MRGGKRIRLLGLMLCMTLFLAACGNVDASDDSGAAAAGGEEEQMGAFTEESTVAEVLADPAFGTFGRLLFPVDRTISGDMTLREQSLAGDQIFYNIYTEAEMAEDPSRRDTGLFFFRGDPGREFAIMNAGGGFYYVGAMHDSFPHALEVGKEGYNAFALIYRPDDPYEDLARAIEFICDNAEELQVKAEGYSLWGGSAGARMAALLGNEEILRQLTGRTDIPQASAVIMQYTGYSEVSAADAPTYACVGTRDGIASWRTMERRLRSLEALGIPTKFHSYEGLSHGFGLGTGTVAEGWICDAIAFWEAQMT